MDKILKEAFEPSKELLDDMGIKKEWLKRWPSELSGGELQRFYNIGLIVISHEKALVNRICDRIIDLTEFKELSSNIE